MQLTKNFQLQEFKSKDGACFPLEVIENLKKLAENLQVLRDELGKPIIINSGYRSEKHNKSVGGAKNSQHLYGKAADIVIEGMTPKEVKQAILDLIAENKMINGGIGLYNTFVHYDVRSYPARW